jgi:ABC-2 type transport system permease protein
MNDLRFALYSIKKNIQSSAELRTSFLMNILGMIVNNTAFILLWVFFVKSVGTIGGWTAADIVGLEAFTALAYGVAFSTFYGIRKVPEYVATGAFDRFLLAPRNLLVRVATSSFSTSAVGDVVYGIICLAIYGGLINIGGYQIMLMLVMIVATSLVFLAVVILVYSTGFLFADATYVSNGLFEFFFSPALFHGGAFQGVLRFIFTFIVPSLVVGTLPVEAVKSASLAKIALVVGLSVVWFLLSLLVFNKAVRKYESSNFMTFGN